MSKPDDKPMDCDHLLAEPFCNEIHGVTIDHEGKHEQKCSGNCGDCEYKENAE